MECCFWKLLGVCDTGIRDFEIVMNLLPIQYEIDVRKVSLLYYL